MPRARPIDVDCPNIYMTYDPEKHHRRSIRLKGFDYSRSAAYFITICVQNRECLFGTIAQHQMRSNEAGQMVSVEWLALSARFPSIILDEFVVMPNHFHGIINISPDSADNPTLGKIIGAFKSIVNNNYITGVKTKVGHHSSDDYGNVIITNISYEMILHYRRFSSIFKITL